MAPSRQECSVILFYFVSYVNGIHDGLEIKTCLISSPYLNIFKISVKIDWISISR